MTPWVDTALMKLDIFVEQGPHCFERHRLARELLTKHLEDEAVLLFTFHFNHRGRHRTSRLKEEYSCLFTLPWLWYRFMFMSPDDQVEECWDLCIHQALPLGGSKKETFIFILVQHEDIEPRIFILPRPFELDCLLFKSKIESLIAHMPNAKDCYFCIALFEQNWNNLDLFNICDFAKIIDVMVAAHLVKCAQHFKTYWVVMISMD